MKEKAVLGVNKGERGGALQKRMNGAGEIVPRGKSELVRPSPLMMERIRSLRLKGGGREKEVVGLLK